MILFSRKHCDKGNKGQRNNGSPSSFSSHLVIATTLVLLSLLAFTPAARAESNFLRKRDTSTDQKDSFAVYNDGMIAKQDYDADVDGFSNKATIPVSREDDGVYKEIYDLLKAEDQGIGENGQRMVRLQLCI